MLWGSGVGFKCFSTIQQTPWNWLKQLSYFGILHFIFFKLPFPAAGSQKVSTLRKVLHCLCLYRQTEVLWWSWNSATRDHLTFTVFSWVSESQEGSWQQQTANRQKMLMEWVMSVEQLVSVVEFLNVQKLHMQLFFESGVWLLWKQSFQISCSQTTCPINTF